MHDPRPVFWLCIVQGLALLCLIGYWCNLSPADRLFSLGTVMAREGIPTAPPEGLIAQAEWLSTYRLTHLTGMVGVLVVAGLVGAGEGIARRRSDLLGGFLLRWWTAGVVGMALVPGAVAGYLLAPWPLSVLVVASGLALLVALVMYGLFAGRPYVP